MKTEKDCKIVFIQNMGTTPYEKAIKHLAIPKKDIGYVWLEKKNKLTNDEMSALNEAIHTLQPEVVIPIGATASKLFLENKKLTKHAGVLFQNNNSFGDFIVCPLFSPGRFRYVKYTSEYKQLDNLKKYLMRYYKYGLIEND